MQITWWACQCLCCLSWAPQHWQCKEQLMLLAAQSNGRLQALPTHTTQLTCKIGQTQMYLRRTTHSVSLYLQNPEFTTQQYWYVEVVMGFVIFSTVFNFDRRDLHNETCVALANLRWSVTKKWEWKLDLPWCSYGYRKWVFIDFFFFFIEYIGLLNCVQIWMWSSLLDM